MDIASVIHFTKVEKMAGDGATVGSNWVRSLSKGKKRRNKREQKNGMNGRVVALRARKPFVFDKLIRDIFLGSVYTRWGSSQCPSSATTVYSGRRVCMEILYIYDISYYKDQVNND